MSKKIAAFAALVMMVVYFSFSSFAGEKEDAVIAEINAFRTAAGVPVLEADEQLSTAAETRAAECEILFSHTRPDGSDWWTADEAVCYGEDLARNYTNASSLVTAWYNSQVHRDVMLFASYRTIGIGIHTAADGTVYTAAEFGY